MHRGVSHSDIVARDSKKNFIFARQPLDVPDVIQEFYLARFTVFILLSRRLQVISAASAP